MASATRMLLLSVALAPYVSLIGVDAWMHERARRVPRLEKVLHYMAGILFLAFVVAVFRHATGIAAILLAVFVVLTAWDELGYHRHLDVRERRVHFASHAALALFLAAWALTSRAA